MYMLYIIYKKIFTINYAIDNKSLVLKKLFKNIFDKIN